MTTRVNNRMIDGAIANVQDFGAIADGITDNTAAFNLALASDCAEVYIPKGEYVIRGKVSVPQSKKLKGVYSGVDSSLKTYAFQRGDFEGALLIMRDNATIEANANTCISSLCFYYDEQNLAIDENVSEDDGYDAWIAYSPTIDFIGGYNAIEVSDIVVLGAYDFFNAGYVDDSGNRGNNTEKAILKNITGCVLNRFSYVDYATDINLFQNIRLNPASLLNMPQLANLPLPEFEAIWKRVFTKISYHFRMFEFNRTDGGWVDNCFAFAGRDFVMYRPETYGTDVGASVRISNSGADMFNAFVRSWNTTRPFGNGIENSWAILGINKVCFGGAPVASRSGVVTLMGGESQNNFHITIDGFKLSPFEVAGGVDPRFDGNTGVYQQVFNFAGDAEHCSMLISNSYFDSISTYDANDPITSLVSGITASKDHLVSFNQCGYRATGQQTAPYDMMMSMSRRSEVTDRRERNHIESWIGGTGPTRPVDRKKGLDSGLSQSIQINQLYKRGAATGIQIQDWIDSSGDVLMSVDDLSNISLFGDWQKGHLAIGNLHIWAEGKNLRLSDGAPTAFNDGVIIATAP